MNLLVKKNEFQTDNIFLLQNKKKIHISYSIVNQKLFGIPIKLDDFKILKVFDNKIIIELFNEDLKIMNLINKHLSKSICNYKNFIFQNKLHIFYNKKNRNFNEKNLNISFKSIKKNSNNLNISKIILI